MKPSNRERRVATQRPTNTPIIAAITMSTRGHSVAAGPAENMPVS